MRILDFYPCRGSYLPGEIVSFLIEIESHVLQTARLQLAIRHLDEEPLSLEQSISLKPGEQTLQVSWRPSRTPAGYSAHLTIVGEDSLEALTAATAFDVLSTWTDFPRYGFLCDFRAARTYPKATLGQLVRFHLNGLQFYDWQYRHDQLVAPTEEYLDPLGREMSLRAVRNLVEAAHQYGMACMPYLAIYAASAEFWRAHADWALYDANQSPIAFGENFLGLMDPAPGGPWSRHLLFEGARALEEIPFDGLHIDQYGDPKYAWDVNQQPVDLPEAFVSFIQSASDQNPDKTILFNAVGNWPIDALVRSAVDFMYIEVWPPEVEYRHLANIVLEAGRGSAGKAVVIALYLPAERVANNLLADAVILACGGTRIELGEDVRLLSDPYFPKHEAISAELFSEIRHLYDFAVRNGEWLQPYTLSAAEKKVWSQAQLNPEFVLTEENIWLVARRYPNKLIVNLVNFTDLASQQRWNEAHAAPTPSQNISLQISMAKCPDHISWDCPENLNAQELPFEYLNGTLTVQIPHINFIGLIAIHE